MEREQEKIKDEKGLSSCLSLYETVLSNSMTVRTDLLYLTQKFVSDADDRGTIKITIRRDDKCGLW